MAFTRKGDNLPKATRKKISISQKKRWQRDREVLIEKSTARRKTPLLEPHCPECNTIAPPEGFKGIRGQTTKYCPECLAYHRAYSKVAYSGGLPPLKHQSP